MTSLQGAHEVVRPGPSARLRVYVGLCVSMLLYGVEAKASVNFDDSITPWMGQKCGTCHGGARAGGNNLAVDYQDHLEDAFTCLGLNVAECAAQRIDDGSMPLGQGCPGPVEDGDPRATRCVTLSERAALSTWIALGQPRTHAEALAIEASELGQRGELEGADTPSDATEPQPTLTCTVGGRSDLPVILTVTLWLVVCRQRRLS